MGNDLSITIIKRDGREEIFNLEKVANAVEKAIRAINGKQPETNAANVTTSKVAEEVAVLVGAHVYAILEEKNTNKISVEDIQDQVEKALIEKNLPDIAKEYILYRKHRNDVRYLNSSTNKVIADLVDVTKDSNDKRENANINAATVMGTMLKVGSSLMKEFNLRNMIRPEHSEKHRQGYIHIHDLDFSSLCVNCIYIPLSKLLNNGYSTGHGFLRQPQTIQSAAALTCIAIQSSQNSFFGGQAIPSLDYALAPYVAKSFARNFASIVELMYEDEIQKLSSASDFKKTLVRKIEEVYDRYGTLKADTDDSGYKEALFITGTLAGIDYKSPKLAKFYRKAWIRTVKDTNQAMESLVHNLCSMASRAGSQTPFSSVNLGLDTTEEGRTVTDALLNALDAGLGLGETAIFPITIFKMKKGITDKGSPNYDLFKKAIRVTAKRGYPNFASIDAPFNLEFYEPDVPETHAAYMGAVYHGMVTIKLTDDNGFWEDTFDMDISRVGELLMQYPWAIKGECKYIDFDDETRYFNVDDKHVKIYDSIRKDWVGIRKYMVFENKKKNWREVTFNGIEDPEFEVKMKLTNDHPLPVYHGDVDAPLDNTQFIRTMVEDVQIGDKVPRASCEGCDDIKFLEVTGIRVCKRKHVGYDFETISDRFDVGNVCSHNCVTGNTRIVLMNPAGRIIYTNASYFRRLGPGVTMLHGWKILSTDGKFVDLINVSIRMETDHVNIIRASHGTIRVTDEHIIPVYRKRKYMELPAKEVQPFDCLIEVPLKDMVKEEDKLQEINLIDLLPANSNALIAGTPKLAALMADINPAISEEEKAKMLAGDLIPDIELDYYRSVRDQLADLVDEDELCLVSKKAQVSTMPIPVKYKLTREFGRFYGLLYSEGCVGFNSICITNSDPEIVDFAKAYIPALLHREKATVGVNKNGCSIVSSHSVLFASLFRNNILGIHNGSGDLKLPNWFFFANDEFLKGFLSGVIDGDGSVVPQNYTRIITSSETFAEDIQAVCSRLGYIVSTSIDRQKGKIAHFKDRISIRKFDNYRVTIDNLDVVDMDLHDSIKARKLKGYTRERQWVPSKTFSNRVYSIEKRDFNNYVYDFETGDHYFAAGTQKLHNCRTHVINNHFDPEHQITEGRGNLFWTTINLPMLALDATHELPKNPDPIGTFFRKVDEIMDTVKDYSLDRFEIVARRRAKNYPFMIGQHEYCTSEQLTNPEDEIRKVIKQGTISIGFIGLAETLIALTGKHHGESEEAQALGLKIIKHMKDKCDQYSNELNLNFSLMATPAEGCTGRLQRAIRNKYGVINGITDKEYLTNSFHVKNDYKISVWKKIDIEAPYHAMCLAGHISYVELDTDAAKNLSALEQIVNYMADSGMGYFALNHPLTRDPICGYVGPMRPDGTCPRCGRKEFEGVPASKLLSLSSYTPDPEYAITAPKIEDKDKTFNSI